MSDDDDKLWLAERFAVAYVIAMVITLLLVGCSMTSVHYAGECSAEQHMFLGFVVYDEVFCNLPHDIDPQSPDEQSDAHRQNMKDLLKLEEE